MDDGTLWGVFWVSSANASLTTLSNYHSSRQTSSRKGALESSHSVTVFNDMASNYSGAMPSSRLGTNAPEKSIAGQASYFEGTNILVYIRGTDDEAGKWWESGNDADAPVPRKGGTLVNAHYDSYVLNLTIALHSTF